MRIFLFLSYSFGIETMYVHPLQFPRKLYPIPDQNGQSVYPFSDQNGRKTLPDGAAHAYIAYIREYPPPPGLNQKKTIEIVVTIQMLNGGSHKTT